MRLIDADRADEHIVGHVDLRDCPTVEAIPVEWIEKWAEKYNKDLDPWFQGRTAVDDMLDDWEKENG